MKKKVIFIDSLIGNDYTFCLGLGLRQAGADIEFIVPDNKEFNSDVPLNIKKWAPAKGGDTYGKLRKTVKYFLYLFRVFIYVISRKNAVVHFQFFRRNSDSILFYLLGLFGARLVYTAHNVLPHERGRSDQITQKMVYKSADAIIVHSGFIKNKLLNSFPVEEKKVSVIPHGNFDIYLPGRKISRTEARKRLNLPKDKKIILFFGYVREYKGLDLLIKAFDLAKDCDSDLHLCITGFTPDEKLRDSYLEMINKIPRDRVTVHFNFIPSEKVHEYFEACDLVVLPYKNIDHSGIIHLAYSFCRPVVATNVGDFPETIEEGRSGFVVPEKTPESLSETILKAVKDETALRRMGEYARHLSNTKYSWNDIAEKTIDLYRSL